MPGIQLIPFRDLWTQENTAKPPHLLLGNGFSRACRNDIFAYEALFDRADFQGLSGEARHTFTALETTDFEIVMRGLRTAANILDVYSASATGLPQRLRVDADKLREVLVSAIAGSHPARPSEILPSSYAKCKAFLSRFHRIYTVNYDLLLYWALMQDEIEPHVSSDDGFRTPDAGPGEYVTWDVEKTHDQNVYYLHGALHIFDSGTELQKYTWCGTQIALIDQIRDALERDYYPLFVAEGDSDSKLRRIRHSDYLFRAYRSLSEIGGTLVIYGHAMAPNDEHIIRLLEKNKVREIFVSIYGDPDSDSNTLIIRRALAIEDRRMKKRPVRVRFFDATSVDVW